MLFKHGLNDDLAVQESIIPALVDLMCIFGVASFEVGPLVCMRRRMFTLQETEDVEEEGEELQPIIVNPILGTQLHV